MADGYRPKTLEEAYNALRKGNLRQAFTYIWHTRKQTPRPGNDTPASEDTDKEDRRKVH
jgi:hypothetical protein